MTSRKVFTIKLAHQTTLQSLLTSLDAWFVSPKTYAVDEEALTITTRNPNVVDVCTEEIRSYRYTITAVPYRKPQVAP